MKTLQRVHNRHGRCYQLAGMVMLYEEGSETFTLVHGEVSLGFAGQRIGHAWIELPDGKVYEPVLDKYIDKAAFDSHAKPSECQRYTREQAVRLIAKCTWGPWTDSEFYAVAA